MDCSNRNIPFFNQNNFTNKNLKMCFKKIRQIVISQFLIKTISRKKLKKRYIPALSSKMVMISRNKLIKRQKAFRNMPQ